MENQRGEKKPYEVYAYTSAILEAITLVMVAIETS